MSAELERWLAYQRRYYADLVQIDDGLPDYFDDLSRRSEPHVYGEMPWFPEWSAYSPWTPCDLIHFGQPKNLLREWLDYERKWLQFRELNPRIALAEMLADIFETDNRKANLYRADDSLSFPAGRETVIREWVLSGFATERPFDQKRGLDSPQFRDRLRIASNAAGRGWVFYDRGERRLIWKADDEH